MDWAFGEDSSGSMSEEEDRALLSNQLYRIAMFLWVFFQVSFVAWGCVRVEKHFQELGWIEMLGMLLSIGIMSGGGVTVAHEFVHKPAQLADWIGAHFLLASINYAHFYIEHVRNHHVNVATPFDPATARLGETVYEFFPRSVIGQYASAWHLENRRISRDLADLESPSALKKLVVLFGNRMLYYSAAPLVFVFLFYKLVGPVAALFFVCQSVIAWVPVEVINYIEHYGLVRMKRSDKEGDAPSSASTATSLFEPVSELHSWNSNTKIMNFILLNIQRHSDHHAHSSRPFQLLRNIASLRPKSAAASSSPSPSIQQVPFGYSLMILISLFPPLFWAIMHPRVLAMRRNQRQQIDANPNDTLDDYKIPWMDKRSKFFSLGPWLQFPALY